MWRNLTFMSLRNKIYKVHIPNTRGKAICFVFKIDTFNTTDVEVENILNSGQEKMF
jgi:hypothetical protein